MLKDSHEALNRNIDKVLDSGGVDIDGWEYNNAPMILPKCIVTALLIRESKQYEGKGTSYEKHVKKEVKNILNFI